MVGVKTIRRPASEKFSKDLEGVLSEVREIVELQKGKAVNLLLQINLVSGGIGPVRLDIKEGRIIRK